MDEIPPNPLDVLDVDDAHDGAVVENNASLVFTDGADALLTSDVVAPEGAADGTLAFDPAMEDTLVLSCPPSAGDPVHPFDANGDCVFSASELSSLIDAWKQSPADEEPTDGRLFAGIEAWKQLPEPYCTVGG